MSVDAAEEPEAAEREWDETLVQYAMSMDELSSTEGYANCPKFAQPWAMPQEGAEWAEGHSLASAGNVVGKRRPFLGNKICIPMAITPYVIREHHESVGTLGRKNSGWSYPEITTWR